MTTPTITRRLLLSATAALPLLALLSASVRAHDYTLGELAIGHPWTRATNGRVGGGFLTIHNTGSQPDAILRAHSPAARVMELHTMTMTDGVMRMRPVPRIELPPGATVTLRPGGLHLMLIDLAAPLRQGGTVPVTLDFARAGSITVELRIEAAGARGPAGGAANPAPGSAPSSGGGMRHGH
ncbi:MAG: copper chaperone PCu(A)C [Alphaproteobacteria bacterium]|nr:copper chaperone PCu(A)C [Alphaproteobacteria bacterium]